MSHLPWQPLYARAQAISGDNQIEALQTDVMRFMAILGLCLMAIFSLVQSLPYQPVQKTPQLESKGLLQTEIKQLQINAAELHEKIKQFTETLQQVQEVKQQLKNLEQSVTAQRNQLKQLNKKVQQEQQVLSEVRNLLEREQRIHTQQQAKLEKITNTQIPAIPKSEKKGFSLHFISDQALLHLLQQQKIKMYLLMQKNAWHIKSPTDTWLLEHTNQPKQYYQMAVQTVPNILRKAAQKQLSVHNASQVVWAVELPQSITSSISRLIKNKQVGDLVITQNGLVQLH